MKKLTYNMLLLLFLVAGSTGTGSVKANEIPAAENTVVIDMSNVIVTFNIKIFGLATISGSFDRLEGIMVSHDETLAPPGNHVMSAVVQFAPHELKSGWDESAKAAFLDTVL